MHWHWLFEPESFMEMFGQGFNTVGAEEYLLHGTYTLASLTVTNAITKETFRANTTSYPGESVSSDFINERKYWYKRL